MSSYRLTGYLGVLARRLDSSRAMGVSDLDRQIEQLRRRVSASCLAKSKASNSGAKVSGARRFGPALSMDPFDGCFHSKADPKTACRKLEAWVRED